MTFEEKVRAARSSAELREICISEQVLRGTLTRERDGSLTLTDCAPAAPLAPQQPPDDGMLRRAVTLPNGVIRVIEGYSVTGLDILEQGLKKQYGI